MTRSDVQLPATYEAARAAIAECVRIDECKDWSDKAAAFAVYARQTKDTAFFDDATRIKARAVRRCGELLKEFDAQGRRSKQPFQGTHKKSQAEAGKDAGLSRHQQAQAVHIAGIPKVEFDRMVESDKPPTISALASRALGKRPAKPKHTSKPPTTSTRRSH